MGSVQVITENFGKLSKPWYPAGILCHRHRLIYYPVPKVACSSFKEWIARLEKLSPRELSHEYPFELVTGNPRRRYPGYLAFAFVRNPWDRLLSCYRSKILSAYVDTRPELAPIHQGFERYNRLLRREVFRPDMPFEAFVGAVARIPDWLADEHFRSQFRLFSSPSGRAYAEVVAKLEDVDAGMSEITRRADVPAQEVPRLNATRDEGYRSAYTPHTAELVARRYRGDLKRFGYTW